METMDTSTINIMSMVTTSFKIVFVLAGCVVALISYFQIKEANKMEGKMSIMLPVRVHFGMTMQFLLSVIYVFASTIYLFVF